MLTYVPASDTQAAEMERDLTQALVDEASRVNPVLLTVIDGHAVAESPWAERLLKCGFSRISQGYIHRGIPT